MPTDTNVAQVILNKLTQAQYESATKVATELYLTPDDPASTTVLGPVKVDGTTITAAADGTITTQAVLDQQDSTTGIKMWTGTKAQYEAIVTKDADTIYNITDDQAANGAIFVTESYSSGQSWYRVWSDGWYEEGGFTSGGTAPVTITLSKTMRDANYSIQMTRLASSSTTGTTFRVVSGQVTTTSFKFSFDSGNGAGYWEVKGFLA